MNTDHNWLKKLGRKLSRKQPPKPKKQKKNAHAVKLEHPLLDEIKARKLERDSM